MEAKKTKVFIAAVFVSILLLVACVVLWHSLGVSTALFVLGGVGLAVILGTVVWAIFRRSVSDLSQTSIVRRSVVEGEELRVEYSYLRKVAGIPAKFRYEDLHAATDNFQALIGRGSSASVFKGILNDGTTVAVKRIEVSEHGEREFRSEVTAIASVQHVNLVRLLGYCLVPRAGARLLVYEFIDNGSLDKWIFPRRPSKPNPQPQPQPHKCLSWVLRYRVAVDVAKALAYLHDDCRLRVLHLDVKPENILLDGSFRALVSDFGLSKLMAKDVSRIVTTVRGTRGYLAPEWFIGRGVSEKCDVFSYGMVLLELVSGRRSVKSVGDAAQREWSYLPRIVAEKVSQGRLMEVVDERLVEEGIDEGEVRKAVYAALWCIREESKMRPSMAQVVDMLQGRAVVEAPPLETEMLILDLLTMEHVTPGDGRHSSPPPPAAEAAISMYSLTASSVLSGR